MPSSDEVRQACQYPEAELLLCCTRTCIDVAGRSGSVRSSGLRHLRCEAVPQGRAALDVANSRRHLSSREQKPGR
jgi:hypothetical protein